MAFVFIAACRLMMVCVRDCCLFFLQVQVKTNARSLAPFHMQVKDPSQHIQTLQENKKFAEDTTPSPADPANRSFTISVPKADTYFPLIRYKCSGELRPVPIVSFLACSYLGWINQSALNGPRFSNK